VCKYYSSKRTLTITQIYYIYLGVFFLISYETGKSYFTFYTLTTNHFLVGSEQESGSMITVVMPATELLSFKVPSTSCKGRVHKYSLRAGCISTYSPLKEVYKCDL